MSAVNGASKTLKILMLHGYTQSGSLFNAKTKALEKSLRKAFTSVTLSYPTGPMKLRASDVPGFDSSKVEDESDEVEAYGWWRRSNTSEPPEYVGIEEGLAVVADTMKREGPFDGVMGFSQGAAMAAMVSSLLEGKSRSEAFKAAMAKSKLSMSYPSAFADLDHPPLKFCISYSGFVAPGERYAAFYEPTIRTPMCHFVGSLDTVVEEARTNKLIEAAGGPTRTSVIVHPGGHFVPNNRQYIDTVVAFIKAQITDASPSTKQEESVEDMDVPF
ncbi:Family of serine hydrolases 3 [Lithohypha guttulata]|uniref:Family of serine hydrolases 3 n=1 Tax=Lithohypha guttulata TaxID=1690604 RepID=A0AAN7T756_9EURO|nr:Family of serine hydrolases 3 [Lithohypha guttulata]KAK5104206.1 Family of serine hydrolases 3 [Lithohypha guttulata]